jgi:uracil-DNA glycosylase
MKRSPSAQFRTLSGVKGSVVGCRRCFRLVRYRERVKPRASFAAERYWRRPVPGFGDPNAELVVVGLAPAAHGGNRTGRVFTGDESGRFLVKALNVVGFANRPVSESRSDGLTYTNCYVTAAVKCAPPGDKPSRQEFENCSGYLDAEMSLLSRARVVLALGSLAFRAVVDRERKSNGRVRGLKFVHGARYPLSGGRVLVASYHPSPRNTNTGKLTEKMFTDLLIEIGRSLREGSP